MLISGKTVALKDKFNNNVFPETSSQVVYMDSGKTLEELTDETIFFGENTDVVQLEKPEIVERLENIESNITVINTQVEKKVDKVEGKQLSTNDFDNNYKESVDNWDNFKNSGGTINGDTRSMNSHTVAGTSLERGNFPMINLDIIGTGGSAILVNQFKHIEFRKDGDQNGALSHLIANSMDLAGSRTGLNGYTTLPNGFIIQWGYLTDHVDGVVIMPIAFPNTIAYLSGHIINSPDNWGGDLYLQYVNTGQFRAVVLDRPSQTYDVKWVAIGY